MAGNTRGKLKEHLEGIHRNFDWIIEHCNKSNTLIGADNPPLTSYFETLKLTIAELDEQANAIYGTI